MAKGPKTADVIQTVSRRAGIWRIRFEINAASHSFKSFHQITPSHRRHIPVRRERCIKGERFSARIRSEGPRRQMQDLETGREGSFSGETVIFPKQEIPWTSGRGLAVRFGPASWASLVIEFCQKGGFYFLAEKFPSVVCFCRLGMDYLLPEKFPSLCVFKRCILRGPFGLSKPENSEAPFRNSFQRGDMGG